PNLQRSQQHREPSPHPLGIDKGDFQPSSGGGGVDGEAYRLFTLPELRAMSYKRSQTRGHIVAIWIGRPEDPDWDAVEMHHARRKGRRQVYSSPLTHRTARKGSTSWQMVSHSVAGKRGPVTLYILTHLERRLLRRLLVNKSIRRLASFQSSAFATYAPKFYQYCCVILKVLFEREPGLVHNFSNSISLL
ncbi:hypothetical protein B0H10DRAFT_2303950, partial [Mycena sp. CBHHK59/15]